VAELFDRARCKWETAQDPNGLDGSFRTQHLDYVTAPGPEKICSSLRKSNDSTPEVRQFAADQIVEPGVCCDPKASDLLHIVPSENPQPRL
jgi:hypothetical protein